MLLRSLPVTPRAPREPAELLYMDIIFSINAQNGKELFDNSIYGIDTNDPSPHLPSIKIDWDFTREGITPSPTQPD